MNRNSFITINRHLKRQVTVWSVAMIILLITLLLGAGPLRRWSVARWQVDDSIMEWMIIGIMALCVFIFFVVIIHIGHNHKVNCPKCGTSIQAGFMAHIAIATGKCGNCGNTVFTEEVNNVTRWRVGD